MDTPRENELEAQVERLKGQVDYLEHRLRLQSDLHEKERELVKLHGERVDRLQRERNELEQKVVGLEAKLAEVTLAKLRQEKWRGEWTV